MSPVKEPWYFSIGNRAQPFQGPRDAYYYRYLTRQEYEQLFAGVRGEKVIGEASTDYLYCDDALNALRREFPNARFVAMLRDPAERAYSQYVQHLAQGREPCRTFWQAIEAEDERMRQDWCHYWFYRTLGFYGRQLARFFEVFHAEQIKVILLDELRSKPAEVYRDLFRFLDIDDSFIPTSASERHNAGQMPSNQYLQDLISRPSIARSILRRITPQRLRAAVLRKTLAKRKRVEPPKLAWMDRMRLIAGYSEDIVLLESLIGRRLSAWLECPENVEVNGQSK